MSSVSLCNQFLRDCNLHNIAWDSTQISLIFQIIIELKLKMNTFLRFFNESNEFACFNQAPQLCCDITFEERLKFIAFLFHQIFSQVLIAKRRDFFRLLIFKIDIIRSCKTHSFLLLIFWAICRYRVFFSRTI